MVWSSVWSLSNLVYIFLTNCLYHFHSYILQKTTLKFFNWFQRYEQLRMPKTVGKKKTFSALFGSILKSVFPTFDWFCLITLQLCMNFINIFNFNLSFSYLNTLRTFLSLLFWEKKKGFCQPLLLLDTRSKTHNIYYRLVLNSMWKNWQSYHLIH